MKHKPFVFFGTPYVARDTLLLLLEAGYVPTLVVTGMPKPSGRGLEMHETPVAVLCKEKNIPCIAPEKITDEVREKLAATGAEYGVVVAYGKILSQKTLDVFPLGLLNVHYSLLPKYRGASPVEAALLHDEKETGVCVQRMALGMDEGDLLACAHELIHEQDTTTTLRTRLIKIGTEILVQSLPLFESGNAHFEVQVGEPTYCKKIEKSEGEVDLAGNAKVAWNKYRAYIENPGTYFFVAQGDKKVRVKIKTAQYAKGVFTPLRVVPESKSETDYALFMQAH